MKITAVQSGQIMTTVRFTMANGQVLSVSVEP
jgi:anti-sigma-K factor RskA